MEDSEQRKKRLKEMRTQADLAEGSSGAGGSGMPGFLSNPLVEAPSIMLLPDKSYAAAPRFDFYTDPMHAFSSDRRSNAKVQAAPDYFPPNFGGSPMPQFSSPQPESTNPQMTPSPTQVLPTAYRNPPVWNGPRGPAHYNFPFRPSGGGTYPSPRFEPSGGPLYNSAQGMNHWPNHSPNPSPGYMNSPRFEPPGGPLYNSAQGMNHRPNHSPHPSPGYRNSPRFEPPAGPLYNSAQGMNHRPNHSPNPSSPGYRNSPSPSRGRGRGFWHNTRSPVSGRGSGQGSSSHGHWSNEDRARGPDRFYKGSMVEDPWKFLKPVIWDATDASLNTARTPENSKPWTSSKSVSTKREGSSAASVKFNSEPSLAEYLAAAFNEAANSEENV